MKNIKVYIGTIKLCLDINDYKKDGNSSFVPTECYGASKSKTIAGFRKPNVNIINNQAILIQDKNHNFYEFKLTNTFIENLKIVFKDPGSRIKLLPEKNGDIFIDSKLTEYYDKQPKTLSLRKLRKDLLMDSRIKTGIEH